MKLIERLRRAFATREEDESDEDLLAEGEDPFTEPVPLEIRDVIDLHAIPPKQVKAVVEEYLLEARQRGYRFVRIIHGKGIGVQRQAVRAVLDRAEFIVGYRDAPPEAGGLGATIAEMRPQGEGET